MTRRSRPITPNRITRERIASAKGDVIMRPSFAAIVCAAAISALAGTLYAQNSPPESAPAAAPPAFPTPGKAPTPESPQNTTNASAQAEADYRAARAMCDTRPQNERSACISINVVILGPLVMRWGWAVRLGVKSSGRRSPVPIGDRHCRSRQRTTGCRSRGRPSRQEFCRRKRAAVPP